MFDLDNGLLAIAILLNCITIAVYLIFLLGLSELPILRAQLLIFIPCLLELIHHVLPLCIEGDLLGVELSESVVEPLSQSDIVAPLFHLKIVIRDNDQAAFQ